MSYIVAGIKIYAYILCAVTTTCMAGIIIGGIVVFAMTIRDGIRRTALARKIADEQKQIKLRARGPFVKT